MERRESNILRESTIEQWFRDLWDIETRLKTLNVSSSRKTQMRPGIFQSLVKLAIILIDSWSDPSTGSGHLFQLKRILNEPSMKKVPVNLMNTISHRPLIKDNFPSYETSSRNTLLLFNKLIESERHSVFSIVETVKWKRKRKGRETGA